MYNNIITLMSLSAAIFISGCSEELITKKTKQAEILQLYTTNFSDACEGKLSMTMNFTGDIDSPVSTSMSCDNMKKDHEIFQPLDKNDVKALEHQIRELN